MLSATPWITDSTMVQNIVIVAIVLNLQRRSSYKYSTLQYTAKNIMAMSLHLCHVPQADMLECRLEIIQIVPHPKTCMFEYAAPIKGISATTYWQMTHI
jgi:hypothetical protein